MKNYLLGKITRSTAVYLNNRVNPILLTPSDIKEDCLPVIVTATRLTLKIGTVTTEINRIYREFKVI